MVMDMTVSAAASQGRWWAERGRTPSGDAAGGGSPSAEQVQSRRSGSRIQYSPAPAPILVSEKARYTKKIFLNSLSDFYLLSKNKIVGDAGFEPRTSALEVCARPMSHHVYIEFSHCIVESD